MTNRARLIAAGVLIVLLIGGVVAFRGRGSGNSAPRTPAATTAGPSSSSVPSSTSLAAVTLTLTPIASVEAPTAMAARNGDTSLYVTERIGRVRRLRRSANTFTLDSSPVIDLSSDVKAGGEQGLLGLAFSADGKHLYVAFTNTGAEQQVDEVALDGDRVVDGSRRTLLVIPDFAPNHNGGDLVLGPDGFLYYTMGDGGGGGDPRKSGQNPNDLLGDILRIDPTRPSSGKPYGIPSDNPFADGQGGAPEVWAYGLRNPWRMSFDRQTKDVWIADVGQNKIEEVDFLPAGAPGGANFGWNAVEGTLPFAADGPPDGAVPPIYEYDHSGGRCSITGGYVYRGKAIPTLGGTYLFGDNCEGEINGLRRESDGTVTVTDLQMNVAGLSSFGEDNDGELYALGVLDGSVSRIDATPVPAAGGAAPAPPATTPVTTLSSDPTTAADQLVQAEAVIRNPASSEGALAAAAHVQQLAYRRLGRQPELFDMILSRAPAELREALRLNLAARDELSHIPGAPLRDTLPAWRIIEPAPQAELLSYYHEAEAGFGVGWNYLASINLIESALGRIQGLSSAGAQGPMQFMPATWEGYGEGGDINSPHDSIIGAARYLAANGFADGNVDGSLYRYNNSTSYVNAIKDVAAVLALDPQAFAGYYRWEVFYVTTLGDVHLPVGYETPERISAAEYIAAHPQEN
jgi:glucose/arabinose dehydrogenase/soluble lytic murein transglycosylase-like protein